MRFGFLVGLLLFAVAPACAQAPPAPDSPDCEIVTVSTSWSYPYVAADVHDECLSSAGP